MKNRKADRHKNQPFAFRPTREQEAFIQWFMNETGLTRNATLKQGLMSLALQCKEAIYHDRTCCSGTEQGRCPGRLRWETENNGSPSVSPEQVGAEEQDTEPEIPVFEAAKV